MVTILKSQFLIKALIILCLHTSIPLRLFAGISHEHYFCTVFNLSNQNQVVKVLDFNTLDTSLLKATLATTTQELFLGYIIFSLVNDSSLASAKLVPQVKPPFNYLAILN
jgi:hypothetical protein